MFNHISCFPAGTKYLICYVSLNLKVGDKLFFSIVFVSDYFSRFTTFFLHLFFIFFTISDLQVSDSPRFGRWTVPPPSLMMDGSVSAASHVCCSL